MKKSFFLGVYVLLVVVTLFLYYSVNVPPDTHPVFVFLPFLIPVAIIIHLVLLPWLLFRNRFLLLGISLLMLVAGFKFLRRSFNFGFGNYSTSAKDGISLLSYNVRIFNNYAHLSNKGKASRAIIEFAENKQADIKCFQEFYVKKGSELFNTIKKTAKKNPYYYFSPSVRIANREEYGLAIFSKYPIVNKGEVHFPKRTYNQAIFADLVVGADTVRVYNIHLQSMSINEKQLPAAENTEENAGRTKELVRKLKAGAAYRTGQVNAILTHIAACRFPVILAGDLNDTPYSYTYEQFREKLHNAFENKGFGFGFTYNGKLFFLRIDNIFSDERINILYFKTLNNIPYSDHFPIEATFTLKERE